MLQVTTIHKLGAMEFALRRAAQRREAGIQLVTRLSREGGHGVPDSIIFLLSQPSLYTTLLSADVRFAAFLPLHVAACEQEGQVTLHAISPCEICGLLGRRDLEPLAAGLETSLREILEEAARPMTATAGGTGAAMQWSLGATENQMSRTGAVAPRIDDRGSKVEELAGTGTHDAPGG